MADSVRDEKQIIWIPHDEYYNWIHFKTGAADSSESS